MKIVIDDKIPFIKGVLEPFADVVYVTGKDISRSHLIDADALIVRTRTKCNQALLEGTKVRFVGTATIGFDHIDSAWCEENGIIWKNAPGCNAYSVNQYIASTLFNLSDKFGFKLKDRVLGVVGIGNVGSKVVRTAELLGMRVYLCDPPRARSKSACGFISLEGILRECDIITFHVPLNREGEDKTLYMVNESMLSAVNKGTIIINTSRGEVADGQALKSALKDGRIGGFVLDVWENEPEIDLSLMNLASQATPHIAGYSLDGKAAGTAMIVKELSLVFDLGIEDWLPDNLPSPAPDLLTIECRGLSHEDILKRAVQGTYQVSEDDLRLRENPSDFEKQRGNYPPRREFPAYTLNLLNGDSEIHGMCQRLGFKIGTV